MNVFGKYAACYDLFYRDKDYAREARFVQDLIQKHTPHTRSILDLGCGTGIHARYLAESGYEVHGVDISRDMLVHANGLCDKLPSQVADKLSFSHGDIRYIKLDRKFDAVIALFHVMSYQPADEDIVKAFRTAADHLDGKGVFIFDCWYGPAVLADPPVTRTRRLENKEIQVTRIASPEVHTEENCVDVNYQVSIVNRNSGEREDFQETHRMRYLFRNEVQEMMAGLGMEIIQCSQWLTHSDPDLESWGVYFVVKQS